jgi:tryptophanyl-tRNA synthetase
MAAASEQGRIFSAIEPTGAITLGNYLPAVKGWVELQRLPGSQTLLCVADYHALTVQRDPSELRADTLELVLDLLGCGIDPGRSTLFLQSQVPEHTELAWIL